MSDFKVGDVVKIRFGMGARAHVQSAKVLAHKSTTSKEVLIEALDGKIIATANPAPIDQDGVKLKVDLMCTIDPSSYTREKAFKTLGYKHMR